MKNASRKTNVFCALAGLLLCLSVCLGVFTERALPAQAEHVIVNAEIAATYDFGTSFALPESATVDGQTLLAESVYLVYPNGVATRKSRVTLDQSGEYALQYVFVIDGKRVYYTQRFRVATLGFGLTNAASRAFIGTNDRYPEIPEGVQIQLSNRDELTFREIVNLADNDEDAPFLSLYALPQTPGEFDAAKVKVRLTDLYDAENYVDIYIKSNAKEDVTSIGASYLTANANGQPPTGLEDNTASNAGVKVRQNDQFGFPAVFSLAGAQYSEGGITPIYYDDLNLYFDAKTKRILTDPSGYCSNARLIADLDDTSYFTKPWKGFTTGEVRVSITGLEYQTSLLHLVVTSLDGKLPEEIIEDTAPPTIKVDTEEFAGSMPFARIGEKFTTYSATAFDKHDGVVEVTSAVFYNYYSPTPFNCSTVDGTFTPTRPGVYTIEYRAKDRAGNVACEQLNVEAFANSPLQVEVQSPLSSGKTGETVALMQGLGAASVSGTVRYCVVVTDADGAKTEVDSATRLFTPMHDGAYEVTVEAYDYVSVAKETFTFTATPNAVGKIFEEAALPRVFLKGVTYALPTLYGYDFSSGKGVRTEAQISVKEDGGQSKTLQGNTYVVQASAEAVVEYALSVGSSTDKKTYTIPVVNAGFGGSLDQAKLFRVVQGAAEGKAASDGVTYTTNTNGTTLEFINRLQAVEFSLSFLGSAASHAFTGIHITLTDTLNAQESVRFSFEKSGGGTVFSVNGGLRFAVDASLEGANRTSFLVNYDAATKTVTPSNNLTVSVDTYENGAPFEGFTTGYVYLSIRFDGVSGPSAILFQSLNNHRLRNDTYDRYAPGIVVSAVPGDRNKDDVVVLPAAVVADVVDASVTSGLTVKGPDGNPITAEDGTLLQNADLTKEYSFVLRTLGRYTISYTASDSTGNKNSYSYTIAAVDQTPPQITIQNAVRSGKVGARIAVASVTVTDNATEKCEVVVFVEGPSGSFELVKDGYFVPRTPGEYRVHYMAIDEANCCGFASYTVTVQ